MSNTTGGTGRDAEVFGPYVVYERLGIGGMATVHRAKERGIEGFERQVALKRLLPHLAEDESFVRAFVREAKLASMLQHPNIVQLHELGRVGHVYFISMELIDGRDIRQVLKHARRVSGPPPLAIIVALLSELCDALDYAHNKCDEDGKPLGLVHRDVSPSNLLVCKAGHLKMIDFGIAKATAQHLQTHTNRVKGKMAYMAPESIKGKTLDGRSDIFSAGIIAHELLTARPLFATKSDYQTLMRVQKAPVAPPSTYNPDCPPQLDAIVLRALHKNRDERYQSAAEMRLALQKLALERQWNTSSREVAAWMEWAFSLTDPVSSARRTARATPPRIRNPEARANLFTPPTRQLEGGLPALEHDDEVIEIAWGGRAEAVPVLLDDVPDRSNKIVFDSPRADDSGSHRASRPRRADSSSDGGTLVTHVPPPPGSGADLEPWAFGALTPKPPIVTFKSTPTSGELPTATSKTFQSSPSNTFQSTTSETFHTPTSRDYPEAVARRRARGTGRTPVIEFNSSPSSRHRTSSRTRLPTLSDRPIAESPRTERATTSFGAGIVESQRAGRSTTMLLAGLAVAAIAAVALMALRGTSENAAANPKSELGVLKISVDPPGASISVAGNTYEGSPVRLELEPGTYTIDIQRDGYKSLSSSFDVTGSETQTVRIVLAPVGSAEVARTETVAEPTPQHDSAASGSSSHSSSRSARRRRRRRQPRIERAREPVAPAEPARARTSGPDIGAVLPLGFEADQPPVREAAPSIVPASVMKKVRGTLPRLRMRGGSSVTHISIKLCVDARGRVISVKVLSDLPSDVTRSLRSALKRWKYRPYKHLGRAVGVCFAPSFRAR